MSKGVPGLAGVEHIGLTVPDLDEATAFFVDVIGCEVVFEVGPFRSDDDWMATHLNVQPRAEVRRIRMLRCGNGPSFEVFEFAPPEGSGSPPANSAVGGHHLAFYVEDMAQALDYLRGRGVRIMGEPTTMAEGPSAGLSWVYFLAPWGLQLELVSYPAGMAYEKRGTAPLWRPRA